MTGHLREFWITIPEEGRGPYGIVHTSDDGIHKPGFIHVREVPQPRTIYLCEFQSGERSFHATAIDATKMALSYGPGATVSEWRGVL